MACRNAKGFLVLRRSYAVAAESANVKPAATLAAAMRKAKEAKAEDDHTGELKEKNFWMRDPKTGNWIPENHFNEVDVAELREQLLSRK